MFYKALKTSERVLGQHPTTADCKDGIALILELQGKSTEAKAMLQEVCTTNLLPCYAPTGFTAVRHRCLDGSQ